MATVRALSVVLLLALCFAACACAPGERMPKNRYISYVPLPTARGGNDAGPGRTHHPGCSSLVGRCPSSRGPARTKAGATTAAISHAALPSDHKHPAQMTAGVAKTGATGSKGRRYISPAAMSADKPCDRLGCPSRP